MAKVSEQQKEQIIEQFLPRVKYYANKHAFSLPAELKGRGRPHLGRHHRPPGGVREVRSRREDNEACIFCRLQDFGPSSMKSGPCKWAP
ncbi:MAG: hypothetical protein MZV70_17045 [Desulfobacterales bacterium]|nr:hypothetical protein [Desulfobacterales bacterium]